MKKSKLRHGIIKRFFASCTWPKFQRQNFFSFFPVNRFTGKCRAQPVKSVFRESYGKLFWKPAALVSFSSEIFWWHFFWHVTPPLVSNDTFLYFYYCWTWRDDSIPIWIIFEEKFFDNIFFDIWHLHWCQMTLFCIFITAEHDEMIVYLSESFLKRNFLTIFFLTFDTSIGVKWHFFVF